MTGLFGTYLGFVEEVRDPDRLGRVKVRVPHVYGFSGSADGAIGVEDIPWAIPAGTPAGGSNASGGISWLPEPGDQVFVRFLDGEPEKPIWEWACQSSPQAETLKLHQYTSAGPKRAGFTRYGHTFEFNSAGLIAVTAGGNYFTLDDGLDGGLMSVNEDLEIQVGDQLSATANTIDIETTLEAVVKAGTTLSMSAVDAILAVTEDILFTGKGFMALSNSPDGTCLFDMRDGAVRIVGAQASVLMDASGNVGILSASGSYVSLDGTKVVISAAPGASLGSARIVVDGQNITVDGSALIKAGTSEIALSTAQAKVSVGTNSMTISAAGINFSNIP